MFINSTSNKSTSVFFSQRCCAYCHAIFSSPPVGHCKGGAGKEGPKRWRVHPFIHFSQAGQRGDSSISVVCAQQTQEFLLPTLHMSVGSLKLLSLTFVLFHTCILLCVQLADIAVDSFCRGIFAGDCRKLSMRSCFPAVYNVEQRRRSLILGTLLDSGTLLY